MCRARKHGRATPSYHGHPIENNHSSIVESSLVAKSSAFSELSEANTSIPLKEILDETHAFITKCIGEWNIIIWQRGWEVIVTRKLPCLKQEIFEWITLCMLEISVSQACSTRYIYEPDYCAKGLHEK